MSSYGAYYYNNGKPDARSDGPPRREECRSPPPARYVDRPETARFQGRRRSITPPDGERRVPYYQEMERPKNPGSTEERNHHTYGERPKTAYVPAAAPAPQTPMPPKPPERPESPDFSIVSELSEMEVKPNYTTVDYYTYSKCLERVVSDPNLAMPVRLGIMGKWGSGKSKILKGILWCLKQACDTTCSHLNEPVDAPRTVRWMYRTCYCCDMSFFTFLFLHFVLLLCSVTAVQLPFLLAVVPSLSVSGTTTTLDVSGIMLNSSGNSTTTTTTQSTSPSQTTTAGIDAETNALIVTVSLVAILLLLICIASVFKCLKDKYLRGAGDTLSHFRALVIMALCDTPPPPQATTDKVEMIPICFNASEYADSDDSWSALAKHILTQCEISFGFWKSRLYRICSKDLEHEHDYLIADEDKWRYYGQDRLGARANRSIGSAKPKSSRPKSSKSTALASNGTVVKPIYRKSSLKTKSNKVVATGDDYGEKLNIPVHTAKWRCIGYPMLITISLSSVISCTVVIAVIGQKVMTSSAKVYHYIIIACSATIIALIVIVILKNLILLLFSVCTSPEQRIERFRERSYSTKNRNGGGAQGFMHRVKEEVVMLVGFIRYMEHIYQRRFRILLTIDDLDKCSDQRVFEMLNAVKVLFGDSTFPIVTLISMDADLVAKSLNRSGMQSGRMYINQFLNMRFCLPDSTQQDVVRLLENQAEHLLCSTSVRVNRLKELSDRRYKTSTYQLSRREAIRELDVQHDYEAKPKPIVPSHYYSHPVSARHISTARSRHTKSSKSKKRVVFTPLRSTTTSEEGLIETSPKVVQASIDKAIIPPVGKTEQTETASPPETRKQVDRPDSQLSSRVKSPSLPKADMKRENSTLAEESSDEEQEEEEPEWMLAMSGGEARKDSTKGMMSTRRPKLADSEKSEEQLAEQHIHSVAEMKVLLGVSQGLITALVNNPSYELSVSYDSGLCSIKNMPLHVNLQALSRDQLRRHILAYGLRRRMIYLALDEVRHNIKLLDNTFTRVTQLFNAVYLTVYIWVQKLKQLGVVEAIIDEKESDKAIVKLIKTCQELTRWVMICELWPYRASWLVYKVERVNRKLADFPSSSFYLEASIRDIYKDIRPDVRAAKEEFEVWRNADYSDTLFKKCLEKFKDISGLSVLRYLPFTINIDRVYKSAINQYMSAGGGHIHSLQAEDAQAMEELDEASTEPVIEQE